MARFLTPGDALPVGHVGVKDPSHGAGPVLCFRGVQGLSEAPRVGFGDITAQPCSGLGDTPIAPCPRASGVPKQPRHPLSWKLLGRDQGDLLAALKPRFSEKVTTSPYKNNPEEPMRAITTIKNPTRQKTQTKTKPKGKQLP